jgi:hypothetical protein
MNFLTFFLFTICSLFAQQNVSPLEKELLQMCSKRDLASCERLAALYVRQENWDNALMIGEALCGKEIPIGCTFAGMSLLAKKKSLEGTKLLNLACDKFEAYACRSLGRFMKSTGQNDLSHVYFRRACHFGLTDICRDLSKKKSILSSAGSDFNKKTTLDCSDTKSTACSDKLQQLTKCISPLTKNDCELLPGLLSIFFRAKLIQSEAKALLTSLVAAEKKLKANPKENTFSFDLKKVLLKEPHLQKYHYVFGFLLACSGQGVATSLDLFPASYQHLDSPHRKIILNEFQKGKTKDCYDPKFGFEAFAVTSLDPLNPKHLDIWKINHDGDLMHVHDGAPLAP